MSERTAPPETTAAQVGGDETLPGLPERSLESGTSTAPDRIGKYVVVDRIGRGGVGVVFRAYDPDLDRRVAIKILDPIGPPDPRRQSSMLREAQALARLAHPHVVTVYDVGMFEGRVYLAMEYVEGLDLKRWAQQRPTKRRRIRQIVGLLIQAGRGLAAAHAAGLIHRDIKPANILVGADGRVRVADFGLAVQAGAVERGDVSGPISLELSGSPRRHTTVTRGAAGTPAYMAPEQQESGPVDPRTDQFSFCVMAWEVLLGQRPWASALPMPDEPPTVPAGTDIPRHLRAALERGLAARPEDRFDSMQALLEALARDPWRSRRRVGVAGVAVLGLGAWQALAWQHERHQCDAAGETIEEVWTADARAKIEQAFQASEVPSSQRQWERVAAGLQTYAEEWSALARRSCKAHRLDEQLSAEAYGLLGRCLQERKGELMAMVELLSTADADVVIRSAELSGMMTPIEACDGPKAPGSQLPLPERPEDQRRVQALRAELTRVEVRQWAGRFDEALALSEQLEPEVEATAFDPLSAMLTYLQGRSLQGLRDHARARPHLRRAYASALEHGDDRLAARAAISLLHLARSDDDYALGEAWADTAEALYRRAGLPHWVSDVHMARAGLLVRQGRLGEAETMMARALEHAEKRFGPEAYALIPFMANSATVARRQARFEDALAIYDRVLPIVERSQGADSAPYAEELEKKAVVLSDMGRFAEALDLAQRAHDIIENAYGSDSPILAQTKLNMGAVASRRGDNWAAARLGDEAIEILQAQEDRDEITLLKVRQNVAVAASHLGRPGHAVAQMQDILVQRLRIQGPQHPDIPTLQGGLSVKLTHLGRFAEAIAMARQGVQGAEASLGPEHEITAKNRLYLAICLRRAGELEEARAELEQLLEILGPDGYPKWRAGAQAELAELEALAGHRDSASARLEEAFSIVRQLGDSYLLPTLGHAVVVHEASSRTEEGQKSALEAAALLEATQGQLDAEQAEVVETIAPVLARADQVRAIALLERARAFYAHSPERDWAQPHQDRVTTLIEELAR